jgi:hypothetical protein
MKNFPLDLNDLVPKETSFQLSGFPDKTLTLCRWSLRVRAWAFDHYGPKDLQEIFEKQKMIQISQIAYFMLKEKDLVKSVEELQDAVITIQDQINLTKALLSSVGIGEPEIEKIDKAAKDLQAKAEGTPDPNDPSPNP